MSSTFIENGAQIGYSNGMAYCILRTQKLKSETSVLRSLKHAFRAQKTPNADPSRTPKNQHFGADSTAEAMAKFRAALPEKRRKNGVLSIEYLVAYSPEARGKFDQAKYFDDALEWLRQKHGAENVIYAGVHHDESTPHMYAYVTPKDPDTGKLNCRRFLGGADALRKMQTDFAETVGKPHGLERGLEGSKARHTRVSSWYKGVNAAQPQIRPVELPEPSLGDRLKPKEYGQRVAEQVQRQLVPQINAVKAKALKLDDTAKRLDSVEQLARQETKRANQAEARAAEAEAVASLFTQEQIEQALLVQQKRKRQEAELAAVEKTARDEAKRQREIATERQRRIDALPGLLNTAVAAARTFVEHALAALRSAHDDEDRVEWKLVEMEAADEATLENGQSTRSVADALCELSPVRADPLTHAILHSWAEREASPREREYENRRAKLDADYHL